jgi:HAD superfamily phosphoserine phosphatase-like hydrolase
LPNIYSEALNELKIHSGKNARRVLLSSTPSSVGRVIADSLGIEDIICSELEVVDGYLTGRPSGPLCFREEKAVRMKKYCESNNTTPEESWFYGDSISDFPALSISGFPVCVNPDRKLMKKAIEYGWDTRIWNKKTEKNN